MCVSESRSVQLSPASTRDPTNLVAVRSETKVLDRLPRVLRSAEKEGVGSSGCLERQLVKSQALAAGSGDAGTRGSGEPERGNGQLGDCEEAVVVGDGRDDDNGLAGVSLGGLLGRGDGGDLGDGDRGTVDLRHE